MKIPKTEMGVPKIEVDYPLLTFPTTLYVVAVEHHGIVTYHASTEPLPNAVKYVNAREVLENIRHMSTEELAEWVIDNLS